MVALTALLFEDDNLLRAPLLHNLGVHLGSINEGLADTRIALSADEKNVVQFNAVANGAVKLPPEGFGLDLRGTAYRLS